MSEPTLAERMKERARQTDDVNERELLLAHVKALDSITHTTPIPELVGRWARALKYWCDLTGEPLV